MVVELDVFSGRPNPSWVLDDAQAKTVAQLQAKLNVTAESPAAPPGLGYRGFWYSDEAGRVLVYRGRVRTGRVFLEDPSCSIERYLIAQVPAEFRNLGERIMSELTGAP